MLGAHGFNLRYPESSGLDPAPVPPGYVKLLGGIATLGGGFRV